MGSYQIEDCGHYRESTEIAGIPVYIFEDHSLALPAWGTVSSRFGMPLNIVTFDSHTDTHLSFNSHIFDVTNDAPEYGKYGLKNPIISAILENTHFKTDDFSFEDVYRITIGYLKNTEQILTGADWGYLSSYTIVNREDGVGMGYERDDRIMGYNATYLSRESWGCWSEENIDDPLVVDFDLDFFGCSTDFDDVFKQKVTPLLKRAKAITIAREPKFFEDCKTADNYTNEQALEQLLSFIRDALAD